MSNASPRGLFITVEGCEGVGKTSNIEFIKRYLIDNGVQLTATREPGGTPLAETIRDVLLAPRDESVDPTAELLLVFAARAQHLNQKIQPALSAGTWVLSDRFTDATYAYQGGGRGLPVETISRLESIVQGECQPDLTIFLDLDVRIGLDRARKRGALDRFETEQVVFFQRVREAYWQRIKQSPNRFAVIDASPPLKQVQSQIQEVLDRLLSEGQAELS